jgi:hypothetical protein
MTIHKTVVARSTVLWPPYFCTLCGERTHDHWEMVKHLKKFHKVKEIEVTGFSHDELNSVTIT